MTNMLHDAGNSSQHGTFRKLTALAQLETLFSSSTAIQLHSKYQQGYI
jgi:p-hydroxybenzoate 3-monooxygenase